MRSWLLVVAVVALLAACGGEPAGSASSEEASTPAPAIPAEDDDAPAEPTSDAPLAAGLDFRLPAVDGGQVVGAELAGRHLALWFWAPW